MQSVIQVFDEIQPDPANSGQAVSFGTSGHRGSALAGTFNRDHIVAIAQAIADYRLRAGYRGPLFLGRDSHAVAPGLGVRFAGVGGQWGGSSHRAG